MRKMNLLTITLLSTAVLASSGCSDGRYSIGVLLPVEHKALNVCKEGFKEGLKEEGLDESKVKFIERNAGGNDADLTSYAKDLVSSCDMTFGLGTGASLQLKSASIEKGLLKPVVFSAVTDPVDAKLVSSLDNGDGFCCGSSDAVPEEALIKQIEMIQQIIPGADKIGILYTDSEKNSEVQAKQAKAVAEQKGLQVVIETVSKASDIAAASLKLASIDGMDAFYIPTDNTVASAMGTVKENANSKHVLVIASEGNMLESGGHVTFTIDYSDLGKRTGKMVAEIIKGNKKAADLPVFKYTVDGCSYAYSSANLAGSNIELPQSFKDNAKDVSK